MTKAGYYDRYIETPNFRVPLRIYVEARRSVRASLGKDHVILRIPLFSIAELDKHLKFTTDWLNKVVETNPTVLNKYQLESIPTHYEILILGQYKYSIIISYLPQHQGSANLKDNIISINIPNTLDSFSQRKMIRELTSKIIAKAFKPFVWKRLQNINEKFFQQSILGLTLRYNSTNWGSCSANRKISLSTRSLLLPLAEFDYILVHELSHLIEMNHSHRFWNIVEKVMPDYQIRENYIKSNSSKIDF